MTDDKMQPTGSDIETAKLLAKDWGLQFEHVPTTGASRIPSLQTRKAELARGLHGQAGATSSALTEADLDWLLQPLSAGLESGTPSNPPALQKVI